MTTIFDFMLGLAASDWIYAVVFASVVLDAFFPAFPSETMVVGLAAYASSTGAPNAILLALAAASAAVIGDNIAFGFGRWTSSRQISWMTHPRLVRAMAWARLQLDTRPVTILLTSRYIPFGRTLVTVSAGASGFSWKRYAPLSAASGAMWAFYLVSIGSLTGAWMQDNALLGMAVAIMAAIGLGYLFERLTRALAVWSAPSVEN